MHLKEEVFIFFIYLIISKWIYQSYPKLEIILNKFHVILVNQVEHI